MSSNLLQDYLLEVDKGQFLVQYYKGMLPGLLSNVLPT